MRLITYWLLFLVLSWSAVYGLLSFAHAFPFMGSAAILIVFAGIALMFTDKGLVE